MALIFVDGFDHYTAMPGTAGAKWDAIYVSTHIIETGAYGRFNTNGLRMKDSTGGLLKTWPSNTATVYVGLAHKVVENTVPRDIALCGVADGLTSQVVVTFGGGTMYFRRNNWSGTVFYQCPVTISTGVWYYFEIMFTIHSSSGRVIVKQDGVQIGDSGVGGVNSSQTGNAYCNGVTLGGIQTGYADVDRYFDDLYVDDAGFLGDCRVETRLPNGDGNYEQWTKSAGSHNYECVDENPPVTTDYVSKDTADSIDTYTKAALTTTAGTIKGVAANMLCQKNNAGAKQIAGLARLSSTDLAGSGIAVPASWIITQQILSRPGGGSWSIADVNNAEFGIKVVA